MTRDGWREAVLHAVRDPAALDLLAHLLEEQDRAKERLRRLGFGVIGTPWPEVIDDIETAAALIDEALDKAEN